MAIFGSARGTEYSASRRVFSTSLAINACPFITLARDGTTRFGGFSADATARYGQVRGEDSTDGTAALISCRSSADSTSVIASKKRLTRLTTSSLPNSKGVWSEWDSTRAFVHSEVAQQLGIRPDKVFLVFPVRQGALWFSTARGPAVSAAQRVYSQYRRQRQSRL